MDSSTQFCGNDKLLFGIILGVLAFWLFAQTTLNINVIMAKDLGLETSLMNIAVSITALFSGIFVVVLGGLADRIGRVKMILIGFILSILGSLLVGFTPSGEMAGPVLILGRILQGLSGACIMPASLALIKAYWDGAGRQRAVSLWSIGSWGGSGFCSLFGGLMAENVGWRYIFFASAAISVIGFFLVKGTPESKVERTGEKKKMDIFGILTFVIVMIALQVLATKGSELGWSNPISLILIAVILIFGFLFFKVENGNINAFIDFKLFRNLTYTGATISNFLLNGIAGMLIVSLMLLQLAGDLSAQSAGFLTLGYAIAIVAFIRIGEKLLQKFGPKKPMLWGSIIVAVSIILLLPTFLILGTYKIIAIISYTLFGVGLAFYATPSTDAALSNLPEEQAGAGAGIYKMASSLGAALGVAISSGIFIAFSQMDATENFLYGILNFAGRQDNIAIREAAIIALLFNLFMVILSIIAILKTIPKGK